MGVHRKASNLAVHAELGAYPVSFKAYSLMFRYYNRLVKIKDKCGENNTLLRSAFIENQSLKLSLCKTIENLKTKLGLISQNISERELKHKLQQYYKNKVKNNLDNIKLNKKGKLFFYSTIYNQDTYEVQNYLQFPLPKI